MLWCRAGWAILPRLKPNREDEATLSVSMFRRAFDLGLKPAYVAARRLIIDTLERRAGIYTAGHVELEDLGLDSQDRCGHRPSGWFTLHRILPIAEVSDKDVFIDFGCGMGRIVYQAAARYPFARVIGVESSEVLHRNAQENLERTRAHLRSAEVELICADAMDYQVPDDVTVVYFGNPFTGPIFASVIEQLVASLERSPRRLRIIYFNPVEDRYLRETGFQVVKRSRGLRPTREWSWSNSTRMYEWPLAEM